MCGHIPGFPAVPDINSVSISLMNIMAEELLLCICCSVLSGVRLCGVHELQHTRLPCPSPSPRVCSNSYPLSQWCYLTISSSVHPPNFSSCPQSSQHQDLFQWVGSLHQVAKILELRHQPFQWIFRVDFLSGWLVGSPCCPRDSHESSPAAGKLTTDMLLPFPSPLSCLLSQTLPFPSVRVPGHITLVQPQL